MARGVVGTCLTPETGRVAGGGAVKATPLPGAITGSASTLPMTTCKESMWWPNASISASVPLSRPSFRLSPASAGVPSAATHPMFNLQAVPSIPSPTASVTTHPLKVQAHPAACRTEPSSTLRPHCPPTTQAHARLSSRASACTTSPGPPPSAPLHPHKPLSQDPGKRQLLQTPSQSPWFPANFSLPPSLPRLNSWSCESTPCPLWPPHSYTVRDVARGCLRDRAERKRAEAGREQKHPFETRMRTEGPK